jgi:hypothetical protein
VPRTATRVCFSCGGYRVDRRLSGLRPGHPSRSREYYPFSRLDDSKNLDLWEEYAVPLENPCW